MIRERFVYRKLYKREKKNITKLAGKLLRMKKNEDTFQGQSAIHDSWPNEKHFSQKQGTSCDLGSRQNDVTNLVLTKVAILC